MWKSEPVKAPWDKDVFGYVLRLVAALLILASVVLIETPLLRLSLCVLAVVLLVADWRRSKMRREADAASRGS